MLSQNHIEQYDQNSKVSTLETVFFRNNLNYGFWHEAELVECLYIHAGSPGHGPQHHIKEGLVAYATNLSTL